MGEGNRSSVSARPLLVEPNNPLSPRDTVVLACLELNIPYSSASERERERENVPFILTSTMFGASDRVSTFRMATTTHDYE